MYKLSLDAKPVDDTLLSNFIASIYTLSDNSFLKQTYFSAIVCADSVCVWVYFLNFRFHPLHSRWHNTCGGTT